MTFIKIISLLSCLFSLSTLYSMKAPPRVLLDRRQDEDATLLVAISHGNSNYLGRMLDKGLSVDACDAEKKTLLHPAAIAGHEKLVSLLLLRGAAINAADITGRTPLYAAVLFTKEAVVRLLVQNGALVNLPTPAIDTPLHAATYYGYTGIINLLLVHGAKVDVKDSKGKMPLEVILERLDRPEKKAAHVRLLVLYGASLHDCANIVALEKLLQQTMLPLEKEIASNCLDQPQYQELLRGLNSEKREDLAYLSKLLCWAVIHAPESVDILLQKGAPVDDALQILMGVLLRSNVLNENCSLFVRMIKDFKISDRNAILRTVLAQIEGNPNKIIVNFIKSLIDLEGESKKQVNRVQWKE